MNPIPAHPIRYCFTDCCKDVKPLSSIVESNGRFCKNAGIKNLMKSRKVMKNRQTCVQSHWQMLSGSVRPANDQRRENPPK